MRHTAPVHTADTTAYLNPWLAPFAALNGYIPFMAGSSNQSHQAYDALSSIGKEWQDFLARRFKEDADLLGKFASCRSPEEAWLAYADFWKKAADDYTEEFATIMRLTAAATAKTMQAAQHHDGRAG